MVYRHCYGLGGELILKGFRKLLFLDNFSRYYCSFCDLPSKFFSIDFHVDFFAVPLPRLKCCKVFAIKSVVLDSCYKALISFLIVNFYFECIFIGGVNIQYSIDTIQPNLKCFFTGISSQNLGYILS